MSTWHRLRKHACATLGAGLALGSVGAVAQQEPFEVAEQPEYRMTPPLDVTESRDSLYFGDTTDETDAHSRAREPFRSEREWNEYNAQTTRQDQQRRHMSKAECDEHDQACWDRGTWISMKPDWQYAARSNGNNAELPDDDDVVAYGVMLDPEFDKRQNRPNRAMRGNRQYDVDWDYADTNDAPITRSRPRVRTIHDAWDRGNVFRGEIYELQEVDLFDQEHLFAKVALDDGRAIVVDLGPEDQFDDADIDEGVRIAVQARKQPVWSAQRVRNLDEDDDDTTVRVNRNGRYWLRGGEEAPE